MFSSMLSKFRSGRQQDSAEPVSDHDLVALVNEARNEQEIAAAVRLAKLRSHAA